MKILKNALGKIKSYVTIIFTAFQKGLAWLNDHIKRFFHLMTHNKVIMASHTHILFFGRWKLKVTNRRREALFGYIFIFLWLVGFVWLTLLPLITSLIYSFNRVIITGDGGIQMTPNGFGHYITIFTTDLNFIGYLQEFVGEIILYVPIILIVSMLIAIALNQKIKLRGFFRSVFFLPVIIASGPVINELIQQGAGTVPMIEELGLLEALEASLPTFLAEPIASLFAEMIIILWFSGVQIVLFLAGLQKVDQEIYEAAQIDGASPWESFWKITLPSLRSIILISAIYTIVTLATFSNNSIIRYIQSSMFDTSRGYGYSSALAWIYFVLISIILGITSMLIAFRRDPKDTYVMLRRGPQK